jgi:hypothetical protein
MPKPPARALPAAVAVGGCFVAGLFVRGVVGGVLLLAVAAVLFALSRLTWQSVRRQGRPVRLLVIAAVVGLAVAKLTGKA